MARERPGYSILVCPDNMLLRLQLDKMLAPYGDLEREVYWGEDDPPPQKFWEALTLEGLFGGAKIMLVRQAQKWKEETWKKISSILGRGETRAWPIFCMEVAFDKNGPKIPAAIRKLRCVTFAREKGWLWQNEGLTERSLGAYIQKRATELGLSLERDILEQLSVILPANAWVIENELARFKISAADGRVTEEMVRTSGYGPDCNIFALIRHIENGRLNQALAETARSLDAESVLFPLMALMERNLRQLWLCRAGEDAHFHYSEAQFKKDLARKLGFTYLSQAFGLLCDTEWQIKTGRLSTSQALDRLLIELCALFGGRNKSAHRGAA